MDSLFPPTHGTVQLYHPAGVLVTLPVTEQPLDYAGMLRSVSAAIAAGWSTEDPAMGRHLEQVRYVVRREKVNSDGSVTPLIDLYPANDRLKFAELSVYLNTEEHVAAFERVSGLRLADLPTYIGENRLKRGKSPATDRYVAKAARDFGVRWSDNPKHNPEEKDIAKRKPKGLFVAWVEPPAIAEAKVSPIEDLFEFILSDPTLDAFNARLPSMGGMDAATKTQAWAYVQDHAKRVGWSFNKASKAFEVRASAPPVKA
jgi:hypothetical protein